MADGTAPPARTIDLNAARAARREARKAGEVTFTIGDDTYELPDELPLAVIDAFGRAQQGDVTGVADALRALVGDEAADELLTKHRFSVDDLEPLLVEASEALGVPLEKSPSSPTSSPPASRRSRPRS